MLGCLDACLCARLVADLARIWVAFWRPLVACGVTLHGPCKAVVAFGLDWVSQGTQMSHLALLCGREHRFRMICYALGPESWPACGGLWRPSSSGARTLGGLWRPVAPCCAGVDPL